MNDQLRLLCLVSGVAALMFTIAPASAQSVVYSNLGPGESYDTFTVVSALGPDHVGGNRDIGVAFTTPATPYFLTAVRMPFVKSNATDSDGNPIDQPTGTIRFAIAADAGGLPGAILETQDRDAASFPIGDSSVNSGQVSSIGFGGNTLLAPDTTYWLTYDILAGGGVAFPYSRFAPRPDPVASRITGGWEASNPAAPFSPAFEIVGSDSQAVPEPGALALFLPVLALFGIVHRRRAMSPPGDREPPLTVSPE